LTCARSAGARVPAAREPTWILLGPGLFVGISSFLTVSLGISALVRRPMPLTSILPQSDNEVRSKEIEKRRKK
jgi:hypothetical protein